MNNSRLLSAFLALTTSTFLMGQNEAAKPAPLHCVGKDWRMIMGTSSPLYGELALGWSVQGKTKPDYIKDEEDNLLTAPADAEGVVNYVVNLQSGEIVGKTNGIHASDKAHNRDAEMTNVVAWSESREYVIQLAQAKHFDTYFAELYHLPELSSVSAGVDVLEAAKKAAFAKYPKLKPDDLAVGLHDPLIARQGESTVLVVGVSGGNPPANDATFDCTVTFKITPGKKGAAPQLTLLSTVVHE